MKFFKIVLLFLIITSAKVYALSMGSVLKNDYVKTSIDKSVKFTALFWNSENESYIVELSVKEAPKDWIILIEPNNFVLNSSFGKEYISLSNGYVRATPVDVIVKPNLAKHRKYNIKIAAKTILPQSGISFSQERLLKLVVEIENPLYFEETKEEKVISNLN
ncbi:MAG: hypothetical protein QXD55_01750, partial [Candidatus Aenigmatarchaeota archaeon]